MAKYNVTRACGHDEVVNLVGRHRDREWRLENVEPSKLCYDCYQQKLAEERERENREAAEAAKDMNLPALTGTEKQVAWAETIRQQLLADLDTFIYRSTRGEVNPQLLGALEQIKSKTEARWWIDRRGMDMSHEFRRMLEDMTKEAKVAMLQPPKEVIMEAKAEATVRPENPKTETVAEIRVLDNAVEIDFPEKRDDFREFVKKQFNMKWSGSFWRRKLSARNGASEDRAAEAGHRLLADGFIVRIYDAAIRARAVAGEYEPECTRWIMVRNAEAKYPGHFAISWGREDDFYKAAKRLPGARWDKPSVVVPSEQFAEVLDFAEIYGFRLSEAAQEVAEAARQAKESVLVARVYAPAKKAKVVADGKPPVLDVPMGGDIDDEFKEEIEMTRVEKEQKIIAILKDRDVHDAELGMDPPWTDEQLDEFLAFSVEKVDKIAQEMRDGI